LNAKHDFDSAQGEYGPATAAVRQILTEWGEVDWFAPPTSHAARARAVALFQEHNAQARARLPDLFPEDIDVRPLVQGWTDFAELYERVRTQSWDWKYSALKQLSFEHSKALGWSLQDQGQFAVPLADGARPRPDDLFIRLEEHVMWAGAFVSPRRERRAELPPEHAKLADWYLGYASMDMTECLEWQLAEKSSRLDGNPFLPLLRCYAAGFYPFSLDRHTVVLFAFRR
jgi:hypothetical protein